MTETTILTPLEIQVLQLAARCLADADGHAGYDLKIRQGSVDHRVKSKLYRNLGNELIEMFTSAHPSQANEIRHQVAQEKAQIEAARRR